MSSPIEQTIVELLNSDQQLLNSKLTELSNLSPEELQLFKGSWATVETKRRRQIVHRLFELAEDNLDLNFDSILKHCLTDQDEEVQSTAIEGLWENEEPSLISPLANLLEQAGTEKVQAAAATALGKFAMLAEDKKLRSPHVSRIEATLLAVIGDKNKPVEVRRRALEAAAPLSLPQVKAAITEAYQSENLKLKVSAIYAMGKNLDLSWLPILIRELSSSDDEVRYEAAGACGELEEEETVPDLLKLINDPDSDIQIAAVQALGKIGGMTAKECLEDCLDNTSAAIRQAAEQALNELETKEDPLSFRPLINE
jgi:HEAT repeat protein